MALFPVLRRQTNRGHPINIGLTDGADLSQLGRSTSGTASLYTDNNTTTVTIGGGTALGALLDLRDTNPTTLRSSSGRDLELHGNGASNCILYTNSLARITIDSAGDVTIANSLIVDNVTRVLATVTGINGKTVATPTLYTVPSGKTAIIEKVVVRVTAATAASGDAVVGVGIAAGEDDIISSQELTGLTTVDDAYALSPGNGLFRIADATEVVKLGVDTGDTGTAVTWSVDVIGYTF